MNSIRLTRKVPHRQPRPHPRKSSLCHSTKRVYVLGLLIVAAMMASSHRQSRFENANNFYTDDDIVTPMGGNTIWPSSKSDMQLLLRRATQQVQHDEMNGVDFFWQLPPPLTNPSPHSSSDNIQGILLLVHGCHRSGMDWWPATHDGECPQCLGYPEESAIAQIALTKLRFLVVSMSSSESTTACWYQRDGPRAARVLQQIQYLTPPQTPVFALGVSSSGKFVSQTLPQHFPTLDGFVSLISPPPASPVRMQSKRGETRGQPLLPGVFITMPKDVPVQNQVSNFVAKFRTKRYNYPYKHITVPVDYPVTASFLQERSGGVINPWTARQLVTAFRQVPKMLTPHNDTLASDPRAINRAWKKAIERIIDQQHLENDIYELLNVAYGKHDVTRDGVEEGLAWLLDKAQRRRQRTNEAKQQTKPSKTKKGDDSAKDEEDESGDEAADGDQAAKESSGK